MRNLLIILLSCQLISCLSFKGEQEIVYDQLQQWDMILYEKPDEVLDSLNSLNHKNLSRKNEAYYSLLITIARNKAGIIDKDDSVISLAVDWYKKGRDYRNICRSILYKGLVNDKLNLLTPMLYPDLRMAERIYFLKNIQDDDFKSQIYTCLGRVLMSNKSSSFPDLISSTKRVKIIEEHFEKSIELNSKLDYHIEVQRAKLELMELYLIQNKKDRFLTLLRSFNIIDSLSPNIKYDVYDKLQKYYSQENDQNRSIEYLKKMLDICIDVPSDKTRNSHLFSQIASKYISINNSDSALLYTKLTLKFTENSSENPLLLNYELLTNPHFEVRDFKLAFDYNQKQILSFLTYHTEMDKNRVGDLQSRLGNLVQMQIKLETTIIILSTSILILALFFSLTFIFLVKKNKTIQLEREDCMEKSKVLESKLKRTNLINKLRETSGEALPKLVVDLNKHANRSRKFSNELSDDLNETLTTLRSLSKDKLSEVANSDSFISANPNIKYLPTLSDMEIVVLILFDLKFSPKEISELLNNTQSSVRAIKARIKEKILSTKNLPFDPESTFLIFRKEPNHRS
jgi:tetratricopeptide (TPR) repeat protein